MVRRRADLGSAACRVVRPGWPQGDYNAQSACRGFKLFCLSGTLTTRFGGLMSSSTLAMAKNGWNCQFGACGVAMAAKTSQETFEASFGGKRGDTRASCPSCRHQSERHGINNGVLFKCGEDFCQFQCKIINGCHRFKLSCWSRFLHLCWSLTRCQNSRCAA